MQLEDYYAGKTILITGSTGFLGNITLLLHECREGAVGEVFEVFTSSGVHLFRH